MQYDVEKGERKSLQVEMTECTQARDESDEHEKMWKNAHSTENSRG